MKLKIFFFFLVLAGALNFNLPLGDAQGLIYKKAVGTAGNYCHLKFPAIQKRTLYSSRPVLKDVSEGDIVDFYGSCDYDPLGSEEVLRQRAEVVRERNRLVDGR
ncbi:MAG TPA: hypothetical protein VGL70_12790 [Candidatus Binatia bacterium]|jgi:hypothetical protein